MEDVRNLVPGVDYPRTFQEVDEWFRSDAACREYIRRLRWPGGFICPRCGWTGKPWVTSRGLLHCRGCQGADVADGQDDLSGHPQAVANVVHGDVVRHQPKERRQRSGAAACSRPQQL